MHGDRGTVVPSRAGLANTGDATRCRVDRVRAREVGVTMGGVDEVPARIGTQVRGVDEPVDLASGFPARGAGMTEHSYARAPRPSCLCRKGPDYGESSRASIRRIGCLIL